MKGSGKILAVAVVLLLLINVAMLIMMLRNKCHTPEKSRGRGNPVEMMTKELGLTDQQQGEFKKLKEAHFTAITPLFDSVRTLKKSLFELMKKADVSDSTVAAYSALIAEQQAQIDKATVKHFRTVRALLNADQQKKYDEMVEKMLQHRMARPGKWGSDSAERK